MHSPFVLLCMVPSTVKGTKITQRSMQVTSPLPAWMRIHIVIFPEPCSCMCELGARPEESRGLRLVLRRSENAGTRHENVCTIASWRALQSVDRALVPHHAAQVMEAREEDGRRDSALQLRSVPSHVDMLGVPVTSLPRASGTRRAALPPHHCRREQFMLISGIRNLNVSGGACVKSSDCEATVPLARTETACGLLGDNQH
ncbi:hypothetical protein OBBRIDRAFT_340762 [Obba rivulosa]|uniref:Uncharacterized protein n=1 Tax=Obba rivulosa TaxID=1052685 RepID=A0A8E2DPC0_9APHY|nr:hypothetical protein OBBRIDRAFT_340762 [Obba rivulosa]